MTEEQRYLFDLRGYLVVPGALPATLIHKISDELDLIDSMNSEELSAKGAIRIASGERDKYGHLEFTCTLLPYGGIFESLIDVPTTVPLVEEMIGSPPRLDSMAYMSRITGQGTIFHHGYAELLAYSEYSVNRDRFECVSIKIGYALTDVGPNNGPFTVIPGSHKSNFANPGALKIPDDNDPLVQTIPVCAGDAVLFSEDVAHGAMINHSDQVRRTIFISYAPSFHSTWSDHIVTASGFEERASARQLALVHGPDPYGTETTFSTNSVRIS